MLCNRLVGVVACIVLFLSMIAASYIGCKLAQEQDVQESQEVTLDYSSQQALDELTVLLQKNNELLESFGKRIGSSVGELGAATDNE